MHIKKANEGEREQGEIKEEVDRVSQSGETLSLRATGTEGRALNHERPFSHLLPLKFAGEKNFRETSSLFFHLEKLFNLKHVARTKAWGSREEERSRGSSPPP